MQFIIKPMYIISYWKSILLFYKNHDSYASNIYKNYIKYNEDKVFH